MDIMLSSSMRNWSLEMGILPSLSPPIDVFAVRVDELLLLPLPDPTEPVVP
jgi:hypothetical protein